MIIELNCIPNSWDSFSSSTCGRMEIPKIYQLRTSCMQEESRKWEMKSPKHLQLIQRMVKEILESFIEGI